MNLIILCSGEQERARAAQSVEDQGVQQAAMAAVDAEAKQETIAEPSAASSINFSEYGHRLVSFLARNFYTLKYAALILAFCINFMLLFYQVSLEAQCLQVLTKNRGRKYRRLYFVTHEFTTKVATIMEPLS